MKMIAHRTKQNLINYVTGQGTWSLWSAWAYASEPKCNAGKQNTK